MPKSLRESVNNIHGLGLLIGWRVPIVIGVILGIGFLESAGLAVVGSLVLSGLKDGGANWVIGQHVLDLLEGVFGNGNDQAIILSVLLLFFFLRFLAIGFGKFFVLRTAAKSVIAIREYLFEKLSSVHGRENQSINSNYLRAATIQSDLFGREALLPLLNLYSDTILLVFTILLMAWFDLLITLIICTICIGFFVFFFLLSRAPLKKVGENLVVQGENLVETFDVATKGKEFLPFTCLKDDLKARVTDSATRLARASVFSEIISLMPRLSLETIFIIFILLAVVFKAETLGEDSGLADLMIVLAFGVRAIPIASAGISNFSKVMAAAPVVSDILETLRPLELESEAFVKITAVKRGNEIEIAEIYRFNKSFKLRKGVICCLVGDSGVGKSHLLSNLAQFLALEGFQVFYSPQEPFVLSKFDENFSLFKPLGCSRQLSESEVMKTRKVLSSLRLPGMGGLSRVSYLDNLDLKSFSGGEVRKISLGRALCWPGDVLILDEPFVGMDGRSISDALSALSGAAREKFVIIASHGEEQLAKLSDGIEFVRLTK